MSERWYPQSTMSGSGSHNTEIFSARFFGICSVGYCCILDNETLPASEDPQGLLHTAVPGEKLIQAHARLKLDPILLHGAPPFLEMP